MWVLHRPVVSIFLRSHAWVPFSESDWQTKWSLCIALLDFRCVQDCPSPGNVHCDITYIWCQFYFTCKYRRGYWPLLYPYASHPEVSPPESLLLMNITHDTFVSGPQLPAGCRAAVTWLLLICWIWWALMFPKVMNCLYMISSFKFVPSPCTAVLRHRLPHAFSACVHVAVLRRRLSHVFSACIQAKRCRADCPHSHTAVRLPAFLPVESNEALICQQKCSCLILVIIALGRWYNVMEVFPPLW